MKPRTQLGAPRQRMISFATRRTSLFARRSPPPSSRQGGRGTGTGRSAPCHGTSGFLMPSSGARTTCARSRWLPSRKSLLVGHKRMMEPAVPVSVWCSGKATLETRRNSMKNVSLFAVVVVGLTILVYQPTMAGEFAFTFKWGGIPLCDDGSPNDVSNPIFTLSGVPAGTKEIEFEMIDLDAPSYQHGGGTVKYTGQKVIEKGAFEYESPCPPGETHTYEWQANAKDANGDSIGKATARTNYPK